MLERETIVPLAVGLVIALLVHVFAAVGYGRLEGAGGSPPPPPLAALDRVDLVAMALELPDERVGGRPIDLRARYGNAGALDAGAFELLIEIDDEPVGRVTVARGMAMGAAAEQVFSAITVEAGVHTVRFTVDPADEIAELNESNNEIEVQHAWQQPRDDDDPPVDARPDLVPFAIDAPDTVYAGKPVPLRLGVANIGTGPSPRFELVIAIDGPTGRRVIAGGTTDTPLGASGIASIDHAVTFEKPGEYTVCIVVDPRHAIDETNEANNQYCETIAVLRAREAIGDPASQSVSINTISYEAFEALRARRELWFDQPTAQTDVQPAEQVDVTPTDPTELASNEAATPSTPASVPSPPLPPQPAVPAEPLAEPIDEASKPSATHADLTTDAPVMPERPAEVAVAPTDSDITPPVERTPAATDDTTDTELLDTTATKDPVDAPPLVVDPADVLDLTNPRQPIPEGDTPTVAADLPNADRVDLPMRRTPDAQPAPDSNPTDTARPVEGDPGDQPTDPALPVPPSGAEPAGPQDEPADPPDSDTTGVADATDGEAEQPGEQLDQPADEQPVEVAMADVPQPAVPAAAPNPAVQPTPAATASAAEPTEAPKVDFEAPPVSRITEARVKPGQVVTAHGIRIKTVVPRFNTVARMTSLPRNPVVRIRFDGNGKVIDVDFLRSSGFTNIDSPIRLAIYKWTAEGEFSEDGFIVEHFQLILNDQPGDESRDESSDEESAEESADSEE